MEVRSFTITYSSQISSFSIHGKSWSPNLTTITDNVFLVSFVWLQDQFIVSFSVFRFEKQWKTKSIRTIFGIFNAFIFSFGKLVIAQTLKRKIHFAWCIFQLFLIRSVQICILLLYFVSYKITVFRKNQKVSFLEHFLARKKSNEIF